MRKHFLLLLFLSCLTLCGWAAQEPFVEGKDYFTYSEPPQETPRADGKVSILFFFSYDCRTCSSAQDILALYAQLNPNKVSLQEYPVAEEHQSFSAQTYYSLLQLGYQELSEVLLFETSDKQRYQELSSIAKLAQWLKQQGADVQAFFHAFYSPAVSVKVHEAMQRTESYGVFTYPFVSIGGKYVLTASTLYNDDYSFAVLDFLLDKIQQEEKENQATQAIKAPEKL